MSKLKKTILILVGLLITFVVVVIIYISPLTKYLIEKYDGRYTGRQITLDSAYVNPFTGYIHFTNLKIYEHKSDSLFLSTKGASLKVDMKKLFSKTYQIDSLTFDEPYGTIIQVKKNLNFADIIERFKAKADSMADLTPVHFNILNIKINNGEFHYRDKLIPIKYFIKNVYFESAGKRWDVDTIAAKFSFLSGIGTGDIKGDFSMNVKDRNYDLKIDVKKLNLDIVRQYLKDLTYYGTFAATLDANMHSIGNLDHKDWVTNSGVIKLSDLHFGKNSKEDYISFDKLVIGIKEISPSKRKYFYDSVLLTRPYLKYDRYDNDLSNMAMIFGKEGEKFQAAKADVTQFNLVIEVANYLKMLSRNLFKSHFKVGKLALTKGNIRFNDYSMGEQFSADLNPLSIVANSIDKYDSREKIYVESGIKPYGSAKLVLSIDPIEKSNFDINYSFSKLPVAHFNPYALAYTSFTLDRGSLNIDGEWQVRNSQINSRNHVLIIDPNISKRVKTKRTRWLPLRLIMAFVRKRGNVIDYNIPVLGDMKNPKFQLKDMFRDIIKNIFIKPPTTPNATQVKTIEAKIEKLLTLSWDMRQTELLSNQEKFMKTMANFLKKNPTTTIEIYPQHYALKEKESILFFEAKKKYYLAINGKNSASFDKKDSTNVAKMAIKDSSFVRYMDKQIDEKMLFTIQDKCRKFVSNAVIEAKYKKMNKDRAEIFTNYFKKKEVDSQIKIYAGKDIVPFNGFSFYKIDYKGELPEDLIKAYDKINELDEEEPPKKFKDERDINKNVLQGIKIPKIFSKKARIDKDTQKILPKGILIERDTQKF